MRKKQFRMENPMYHRNRCVGFFPNTGTFISSAFRDAKPKARSNSITDRGIWYVKAECL